MERIAFGTKAETLELLRPLLTRSLVCPSVSFTVAQWEKNRAACLSRIMADFSDQQVIVRSSAQCEDTAAASMAGAYHSVLDVDTNSTEELGNAVEKVILSYTRPESGVDRRDQVLVQPMVTDISMSGVLFTQDLYTGGPYWVINYDDVSGKTDAVTSGAGDNSRTLLIHRGSLNSLRSTRFRSLMEAVIEIEALSASSGLDIEFAVTKADVVYILQVRKLALQDNWNRDITERVDATLREVRISLTSRFKPRLGLLGDRSIFGVMPDWNPIEMIGSAPRQLSSSLYRYLITDSVWAEARAAMGYRDLSTRRLMTSFGGRVYIDARKSFNSYLPADLPDAIGSKIVNGWLDRLSSHPELHDKIEFDIASTCCTFSFETKYRPLLVETGLDDDELTCYRASLKRLTEKIIAGEPDLIADQLAAINKMETCRDQLLCTDSQANAGGQLALARILLQDCRELGTLPFSILARCGFIAEDWLRSFVELGVLSETAVNHFRRSIKTVVTSFLKMGTDFHAGRISSREFFDTYGHLRPGTYDILSKRYDQRSSFDSHEQMRDRATVDDNEFEFSDAELLSLGNRLDEAGFNIPATRLIEFIRQAIQGREYAKLVFTHNLSDALEQIASWGELSGLSREDLSHLSIENLLHRLETSEPWSSMNMSNTDESQMNNLRSEIINARKERAVALAVKLPFLITDLTAVDIIPLLKTRANFITHQRVRAPLVLATGQEIGAASIKDRIVLIENADPGFDWIFLTRIRALVTKYGGANSHMAIRCAELDIPAVIGCGEQVFDRLEKAVEVVIDCGSEMITPVG